MSMTHRTYICHTPKCGLRMPVGQWCPYHKSGYTFITIKLPMSYYERPLDCRPGRLELR